LADAEDIVVIGHFSLTITVQMKNEKGSYLPLITSSLSLTNRAL
jgi:hypothetical protein